MDRASGADLAGGMDSGEALVGGKRSAETRGASSRGDGPEEPNAHRPRCGGSVSPDRRPDVPLAGLGTGENRARVVSSNDGGRKVPEELNGRDADLSQSPLGRTLGSDPQDGRVLGPAPQGPPSGVSGGFLPNHRCRRCGGTHHSHSPVWGCRNTAGLVSVRPGPCPPLRKALQPPLEPPRERK